jgi:hypothetical protein
MDCVFDGDYHAQGEIFEGRTLEGYDKETAKHLEFLDEDAPAAKKGKKNAADDEL